MKNFNINGTLQRVFVLSENDSRVVYIPVTRIDMVDYRRLVELEKKAGTRPLLEVMKNEKFDNGMGALDLLKDVIQVADRDGDKLYRILKKSEKAFIGQVNMVQADTAKKTIEESKTPAPSQKSTPEAGKYKFKLTVDGQDYFWSGLGSPCKQIREYLAIGGTKESIEI